MHAINQARLLGAIQGLVVGGGAAFLLLVADFMQGGF